jgi:glycosyltransferase involved in cell wall biosynthesis
MTLQKKDKRIAVIIPCYNERVTIGTVIDDFKKVLPEADFFVVDNNCTDDTARIAKESGAIVINEFRKGKGYALNCMPIVIDADYYIIVDGDDTYPAESVISMIEILESDEADMVVGNRQSSYHSTEVRPFHGIGNKVVCRLINLLFNASIKDPLSGYRALTKKAVFTLPFMVGGFDVETEMTVQALLRKLIIHEVDIQYKDRPEASVSKLNTYTDGYRILFRIFLLTATFKPLTFFSFMSGGFLTAGIGSSMIMFFTQNLSDKIMFASLSVILIILGFTLGFFGVTIHIINNRFNETQKFVIRPTITDIHMKD